MTSLLIGPPAAYPHGDRIEQLVARVAADRPDDAALRHGATELSYGELQAQASRVAAELVARGVAPGDVVLVAAGRNPSTVVALLALLQAGAAYSCVPADWPARRRRELAARTGARLALVDDGADPGGVTALPLAGLLDAARTRDPLPAGVRGAGTDACCVFLTSGSTGEPKAAAAPHRGVVRTAQDVRPVSPRTPVTLQHAAMAWDVFALELWVTLINGGTCVLFDQPMLTGPALRGQIAAGVSVLALPAGLFASLAEDDAGAFAGLRLLWVGGERLSAGHARRVRRAHPGLRLFNAYGPVENTINSTLYEVGPDDDGDDVPLGCPVTGTSVHLLGDDLRPVAPGAAGEVALGGDGLALGYLGAPEETARRFVHVEGGERVYRTGDLGRIDDAGRLRFVGRTDRQLKIRGQRIEAEEVERLMEAVPGVGRAVAVALPVDEAVKTRLVAFCTGPVVAGDVRAALAAALPAGFVPDTVRAVAAIPLTAHGKADQRALAALLTGDRDAAAPDAAGPAGLVARVARELLGYPVGADEDLFDQGATSLTAIRLATRLSAVTGRTVGVSAIFTGRTPRRIAGLITGAPEAAAAAPAAADPGPETGYVPGLVPFLFGSFWAAIRHGSRLDEAVVPMLYVLRGPVDADALAAALDAMVARHEVLRVRFDAAPQRPGIRVVPAAEAAGVLDRSAAPSREDAVRAGREHAARPFDLADFRPIRAVLVSAGPDLAVLSISVHHIFFDGWSARLFMDELAAVLAGTQGPAAAPPSYFRILAEQRDAHAARYPRVLTERRDALADAPELAFPGDADRPWSGPAAEVPLALDADLVAGLGAAAAAVRGTVMAVFFAAYVRVLRDYTGAASPAVAVPVSGRYSEQESRLVGCMANLLPLRLPAGAVTSAELVSAAAGELRAAMDPPAVPLAQLMPRLRPGFRRHPLLQAYLLQEEIPAARLRLGTADAELVRCPQENGVPELTVELWPHPAAGGVLRYRTDAIPAADAHRLAERFVTEVRAVARDLTSP